MGLPDDAWGDIVTALIVGRKRPPETLAREIAQRLSGAKRPRRVAFVDAIPLTPAGKPDRSPARAAALALSTLHYSGL